MLYQIGNMIAATLTQEVNRPNDKLTRQVTFQEWLYKIRNNYYAQHGRVVDACDRIV